MPTPTTATPARRPTSIITVASRIGRPRRRAQHDVEERVARVVVVARRRRAKPSSSKRWRRSAVERRRRAAGGELVERRRARRRPARARRTAAIASAARSSGTSPASPATSAAKRSSRANCSAAGIHRLDGTVGYRPVAMYPGAYVDTQPDKPAHRHGRHRRRARRSPSSTPPPTGCRRLLRAAGVQPGDHVAFCMENHPRYLEVAWGCHYAGAVYTAASSRLTSGELAYILDDCEAKVFITSKYKADQAAEIVADTPGVDAAADARRHDRRLRVLRGRRRRRRPPSRSTTAIAGTDMLYSSGTTGLPKGVAQRVRRRSRWRRRRSASSGVLQLLFGDDDGHGLPVAGAAVPRRAAALLHERRTALGGTVVVMEHFDAEEYLRARSSATASPTRQVVPTMFVRLLKLPEEVRAALRRVVAAVRDPRRRAVPGAGQAADDRVVRPGDPRVLRRHRGQRLRVLQQRAVAGPPGHGRRRRSAASLHIVGDDGEEVPHRRERHDLLRGRRRSSSTTTTPRRRRAHATRRAGARSATSATSTTTASCTSPTARRT